MRNIDRQKDSVNLIQDKFGSFESGTSGGGIAAPATITTTDHGALSGLSDDDHLIYLRADGVRPLTANWDAGSFKITAQQFESDIATGTAPFVVASTTLVTNLNADLLDSQEGSYYLNSANFTGTNWTDLTDNGPTTLHKHDHGGMDGLLDDDHTQYILLAGRSGGQTILSTAATDKVLILKGFASQSDNLQEWQHSSGSVLLLINPAGKISNASSSTLPLRLAYGTPITLLANQQFQEVMAVGSQSATTNLRATYFTAEITNTASQSGFVFGLNAFAYHNGSAGLTNNTTFGLAGGRYAARAYSYNVAAPVIVRAVGISSYVEDNDGGTTTGSITNAIGVQAEGNIVYGSAFTITNSYNFYGMAHKDNGGVITNAYGMLLEKQTVGTTTNSGIVLDGDGVGSDIVLGDSQDHKIYYEGTNNETVIKDVTNEGWAFGRGTIDTDITYIALRNASGTKIYIYPDAAGTGTVATSTRP